MTVVISCGLVLAIALFMDHVLRKEHSSLLDELRKLF